MDVLLGAYCAARNYGVRCTEEFAPLHAGAYRLVRHLIEHEIHKATVEPARRVGVRARKAEHRLAVGQAAGQQAVPHHAVVCGHRGEAVDRLHAEAGGVTQQLVGEQIDAFGVEFAFFIVPYRAGPVAGMVDMRYTAVLLDQRKRVIVAVLKAPIHIADILGQKISVDMAHCDGNAVQLV